MTMRVRYRTPRQREKVRTGKSRHNVHSYSSTKKGPGRAPRFGPVRPSIASLPEFGVDKKGNVIPSLPLKYMHSSLRRFGPLAVPV